MGSFSELASSSIPSLNAGGDINPTWSRSLRDLKGANETFLHPMGPSIAQPLPMGSALGPPPILSATSNPSKKPEPFLSVTQILQNREDEILNRIWREEEEDTNRRLQKIVDRQLQEDWNREREKWLQDIAGTRTLGGLSQIQHATMPTQILTGQMTALTTTRNHVDVTPAIIQSHLNVVKRIDTGIDIIAEFQNVANSLGNSRQASAYGTAWRLLSCITSRPSSALDAAFGALLHLAKLFQTGITSRVQSAMLANQELTNAAPMYRNAMANKVAMYVRLQLGTSTGVWPVIFHGELLRSDSEKSCRLQQDP